ncbi:uncharacterized protein DS421_14g483680 [Arachis hypogaea]|nr:uncharacterized protein DS421_14g483680 [Arachis hypogaea]
MNEALLFSHKFYFWISYKSITFHKPFLVLLDLLLRGPCFCFVHTVEVFHRRPKK